MLPADYFARCAAHDWFYEFSDDHSAWTRGHEEQTRLWTGYVADPVCAAIFDAWRRYKFSGPSQMTPKAPKPELSAFDTHADAGQLSILDPL